jgi:hypothetical protein
VPRHRFQQALNNELELISPYEDFGVAEEVLFFKVSLHF